MQDLGTIPGGNNNNFLSSTAYAINSSGQIVGESSIGARWHAFLYSDGAMHDLGILSGQQVSVAYSINASGQVVGESGASGSVYGEHAFLYSGGTMKDLGTLNGNTSIAYGINLSGQVVGNFQLSSQWTHAFIYSDGSMKDLNTLIDPTSGWTLQYANAINDSGQIVGVGSHGSQRAFLLTPVPEPSTLVLLGSTLLVLGWIGLACRRVLRK